MTRTIRIHWLVAGLLAATAFSAGAQTATISAGVETKPDRARAAQQKDELREHHCLRHTGSMIRARDRAGVGKRCIPASGRVWTREDLDRTGRIDVADALRTLDPSIH